MTYGSAVWHAPPELKGPRKVGFSWYKTGCLRIVSGADRVSYAREGPGSRDVHTFRPYRSTSRSCSARPSTLYVACKKKIAANLRSSTGPVPNPDEDPRTRKHTGYKKTETFFAGRRRENSRFFCNSRGKQSWAQSLDARAAAGTRAPKTPSVGSSHGWTKTTRDQLPCRQIRSLEENSHAVLEG